MIINHNMNALNAHRNMTANTSASGKSMEKLSSGLRINRAGDDAAGLAISEKMRGQIRGLDQASRNAQDGISLIQTAEGALNETHNILQRMRELAVQAGNDTNNTADRGQIQKEIDQLTKEVDRISETTEFNTKKLLNGAAGIKTNVTGANASSINVTAGTSDTKVNDGASLSLTGINSATGAELTSTEDYLATDKLAKDTTISVNGQSVTFAKDMTIDQMNDKFKELGMNVTVSADTNKLKFTSTETGSYSKLDVKVADGTNTDTLSGVGKDAKITGAEFIANGNTIKITEGDYKGLEFVVADGLTGGEADISVVGNGTLSLQIGANKNQSMELSIGDMSAGALGVSNIKVDTNKLAESSIETIQNAIDTVSSERSKLGAYQNRLEYTTAKLNNTSENLTAAESRVRDVDMAKEMMNFSKNNILSQAAQAMLAQANKQPQGVLQLLR